MKRMEVVKQAVQMDLVYMVWRILTDVTSADKYPIAVQVPNMRLILCTVSTL